MMRMGVAERFWPKVDRRGPDECWEWMAKRSRTGYGQLHIGSRTDGSRRTMQATHIAWELANGAVPAGMCCLHKCDNPPCVNPGHLFLGTKTDNAKDRDSKRRQCRGPRNGRAKLTRESASVARQRFAAGETRAAIAKDLGVSANALGDLISGKTWREQ